MSIDALPVHKGSDFTEAKIMSINNLDDVARISRIFVGSGMFKTDRHATAEQKMYQAGVKIIAAGEFGIGPFAAMKGINIIGGNVEMSSNLMAGKVKAHPKYDYRVRSWDNQGCTLALYEITKPGRPMAEQELLGESTFTEDDAKKAGLFSGNYAKFPRNMYFARAISNGVRTYCPDIFYGTPVYTEGELSGDFEQEKTTSAPKQVAAESTEAPTSTEQDKVSAEQLQRIGELLVDSQVNEAGDRLALVVSIIDREIASATDLTFTEADRVIDELEELIAQREAAATEGADVAEQVLDTMTDEPIADPLNEQANLVEAGNKTAAALAAPSEDSTSAIKLDVSSLNLTAQGFQRYLKDTAGEVVYSRLDAAGWKALADRTTRVLQGHEELDTTQYPRKAVTA